ncbi:MAG: protein-S-isoprenylcysteine O-methyltransferase Ste14 [Chlamydiales bacterium]|jgi:protein-S-isoprenylcysteine O-methyltransferase Ste14
MSLSKLGILLYGSINYVIFLLTFIYCIGFVAGFGTPTNLDDMGRDVAPFAQAMVVNVSLLGLFAVQHMIMARRWFKKRWTRIIHPAIERSTFVLITNLILIAMFVRWEVMPTIVWDIESSTMRIVLYAMAGLGWGGVLLSTFLIDHFDLFGLKQFIRH